MPPWPQEPERKPTPHNICFTVFSVPHVKPVGPPHSDTADIDAVERAFIAEHYAAPFLLSPANILYLLAKAVAAGQPWGSARELFLSAHMAGGPPPHSWPRGG
jgi:hypothetical protein